MDYSSVNYKRLGLLGVGLAIVFWLGTLLLRLWLFHHPFSPVASLLELFLLLGGALLFWWWIARRLTRGDRALRYQARRLAALHEAGLAITTERDLAAVLKTVVDESRRLIGARYGALGVLNATGDEIEEFIVSGISAHTENLLRPHMPKGHGILGIPIREERSVRVDDIGAHPASVGFPPHHPPMRTFLGVPIVSKGKIFGHLYLTDKYPLHEHRAGKNSPGETTARSAPHTHESSDIHTKRLPFSEQDQSLLEMFATQAAIAIENANLYRQNREIAVLRERERFGMDLHDGIIQSIYAIGLLLDDAQHRMDGELPTARERVQEATQRLNTVIGDIRRYIHDLRAHSETADIAPNPVNEIEKLAQTLRQEAGLDMRLELDASILRRLTPRQNVELLQIVREATTNIRRHAQATRVRISLHEYRGEAHLEIEDNGQGFHHPQVLDMPGDGLRNMQRRADALGGSFSIETGPQQGCTLSVHIPL